MSKINRDLISNADPRKVANASMWLIDNTQGMQSLELTLASLACTFQLLAERVEMEPADLFTLTCNLMNHADGRRPEFAAIRDYLREDL